MDNELAKTHPFNALGAAKDRAFGVIVLGLCAIALGIWAMSEPSEPPFTGRYAWLWSLMHNNFGPTGSAWFAVVGGGLIVIVGATWWRREVKKLGRPA